MAVRKGEFAQLVLIGLGEALQLNPLYRLLHHRSMKKLIGSYQVLVGAGIVAGFCLSQISAQTRPGIDGSERQILLPTTNLALLESSTNRTDLPCEVVPIEPKLDFDLRFRAGYTVVLNTRQLAKDGDELHTIVRVIPLADERNARFFEDRVMVPAIERRGGGAASLTGWFDVGSGGYHVDWLVSDHLERVCTSHWEIEARPDDDVGDLPMGLPADEVGSHPVDPFMEEPPDSRDTRQGLHVTLLVNLSPGNLNAGAMNPGELNAIVSILRSITREPWIGSFDVVAFSVPQAQVIYRALNISRLDFPALGRAMKHVPMGTVSYRQLKNPDNEMKFLGKLLAQEMQRSSKASDAVIVIGPKLDVDRRVPRALLANANDAKCPVFYLDYNADPHANPWRDAISAGLRVYHGIEYSLAAPRDVERSLKDMMLRIGKHKNPAAVADSTVLGPN